MEKPENEETENGKPITKVKREKRCRMSEGPVGGVEEGRESGPRKGGGGIKELHDLTEFRERGRRSRAEGVKQEFERQQIPE